MLKMNPLTLVQVAVKNNVDVFYFGSTVPMHVYFVEDGAMGMFVFLLLFCLFVCLCTFLSS